MVGRSVVEQWQFARPHDEVVGIGSSDLDLRDKKATQLLVKKLKPYAIVHAAAKVGGIGWKMAEPTAFLLDNILMDSSIISAATDAGIPEFVYIGTAAVYPAQYVLPFDEAALMTGKLEKVNEGYALAKTVGLKACEYASSQYGLSYKTVLPSNLYGIYDHFDPENAHMVAAAIGKLHRAKIEGLSSVEVWGDGSARREFTYSVDVASWIVSKIGQLDQLPSALNLGCGIDYTVAEYYEFAKEIVGFDGHLDFDPTKPSGVPRRLINSSAAREFGWNPSTSIKDGIRNTYLDYLSRSRD